MNGSYKHKLRALQDSSILHLQHSFHRLKSVKGLRAACKFYWAGYLFFLLESHDMNGQYTRLRDRSGQV